MRCASDQTAVSREEFRREAVELARISSRSQREVVEDLGISDVTLRNWVKQAERDEGSARTVCWTDEREELARLRRENQTLRMEREILKKATAFFAPGDRRAVGEVFSLIAAEKANFPVSVMCRALGVNRTSFHDWERRALSDRALSRAWLDPRRSRRSTRPLTAPMALGGSMPSCAWSTGSGSGEARGAADERGRYLRCCGA